jgi:Zn-dependent M28 family amino/carboxypeptidase
MRNIIFIIILKYNALAYSQNYDVLQVSYYKSILGVLANDSMCGRPPSTIYETKTLSFLTQEFKKLKSFKPQLYNFKYQIKDTGKVYEAKNIFCFINNKADSTILIGAHYDHIEPNSYLSRSLTNKNKIHNGADDNASGVSLLMGLAKNYNNWKNKKYNYLFVSYSAHEVGLYGSTAFAGYCAKKNYKIKAVFNFDMVGRLDKEAPVINFYGIQTVSDSLKNYFKNYTSTAKIYYDANDKIFESDCKAFADKGTICLFFSTGTHNDYHKITDDEDKINYDGILYIQKLVEHILKTYF